MTGVNKAGQSQGTQKSSDYQSQMKALNSQIKEQAQSLEDLKNAKKIKTQMIALAQANGDIEKANELQKELDCINSDIARNTSIFG